MNKSNKIEVTSMSSRGQIVIPLEIREELNLNEGEKFIVIGEGNTIILKRITPPSFNDIEKIMKKTLEFAKNRNLSSNDLDQAIKRARKK